MSTYVQLLKDSEINALLSKYQFTTTDLPKGTLARMKTNGYTVTIYNSKKFMVQGADAETMASQLLGRNVINTQSDKHILTTTQYDKYNCIGSDEAGSGDYFGPLTVAAAYVSKKDAHILKTLGVMDSKRLNDEKICQLAKQIITFLPYSLLILDNGKYNERKQKGWSQVKMKAVLHNECIRNVLHKINTTALDYIVIDQFAKKDVYNRYILTEPTMPEITKFETKGESKSIAIAAASIIARYAFVKHMDALSEQINMPLYKGASNKVDLQAAKIIDRYSLETLDQITKKDFKNREKALQLIERKRS